ncbi:hypothetical protein BKA56DRAFT_617119 [Ilyonectria sp. MPI-CAGE-AT-0026]|nr:hypothetical protein BKA56DRAFT_617119 [Ilyonectria sp. MPI-CAGE-AT-0026]
MPPECPRHKLAIRLHSIQALAACPISEYIKTPGSLLDAARHSIRLFQRVWSATLERCHYLNLAMYVLPISTLVDFFELSRYVLHNELVVDEDLELLQSFASMTHTFADWAEWDLNAS